MCYISDLTKMKTHYPHWSITRTLDDIFVGESSVLDGTKLHGAAPG